MQSKAVSTLTIYLVLSALCFAGPEAAVAAEPGGPKTRDSAGLRRSAKLYFARGQVKEGLAAADTLVAIHPNWQNYLLRANFILNYLPGSAAQRSRLAVKDCLGSLALQKSPFGYRLLTRAYLSGGAPNYAKAAQAAAHFLDASGGVADGLELVAFTSFLAGDYDGARAAVVRYTDAEVKYGHPQAGIMTGGSLPPAGDREMSVYLTGLAGASESAIKAKKTVALALTDFCHQRFESAFGLGQSFQSLSGTSACASPNKTAKIATNTTTSRTASRTASTTTNTTTKSLRDFGETLTICADLLKRRHDQAGSILLDVIAKAPESFDFFVLVDDLYFDLDKRDEGLKFVLQQTDKLPKTALAARHICDLSRAKVLDEMGQSKEALPLLQKIVASVPQQNLTHYPSAFQNPLLELARLESKLNDTAKALEHLQMCIKKDPHGGQAFFLRAQIYAQKKQWSLAAADLTEAIKNGFSLVKALRARAGCYASMGQESAARDDMNLAAELLNPLQ